MDNNTNNKHAAGGPPMTFAMPMYHDFVPKWIRPWIYVVLAFCFQLSNGMYLGAMNNIVGEWGIMREDVQMCLYATLIGMALYFPVLFRMKFRFSNKLLLMMSAAVIVVCNILATFRMPLPLLWALCVVCGMAKIQGTFECMSNIQLWMTPKRDFGVFFPILHIILLSSIEVAGYLAAWFAFDMHWTYMHWLVMALMLVDSNISIEQLRIPILWRGFSYAVLCISFMWCLHAIMSFEHFFQALSVFNVLHMFVGGLVGAALHGRGMKYYVADGFARCSGYVDSVRMSARAVDFPQMMNGIVEGFLAQSVKILFGWTLIAGLFFAALMLLWDIPMVRHQVKHIPAWPVVGMRVLRGVQRQRRLKRLRHLRRSLRVES